MKRYYEVSVVEMDEEFNNSIQQIEMSEAKTKKSAIEKAKFLFELLKKNAVRNCYVRVAEYVLQDGGYTHEAGLQYEAHTPFIKRV
jgi:hypothetical protein